MRFKILHTNEQYNAEYIRDTLKEYLNKPEFLQSALKESWIEK